MFNSNLALHISSRVAALIFCVSYPNASFAEPSDEALWNALKSNAHVILMRHSIAPGTGDPLNFDLGDCSTQRNLSSSGREQAKRIGDRFRENGVVFAAVYSSPWCRCIDTAELLDFGEVTELEFLGSFYLRNQRHSSTERTQLLRQWITDQTLEIPSVLVSHQVNITALTGIYPAEGELVILSVPKNGEIEVLGSIKP